jgi:hypothetical protein
MLMLAEKLARWQRMYFGTVAPLLVQEYDARRERLSTQPFAGTKLEAAMWLAGWAVRVLLLIAAPLYYFCRFVTVTLSSLDEWSWRAIHRHQLKKPAQSANAPEAPDAAKRTLG